MKRNLTLLVGYYLWMDRRQTTQGRKARIESELMQVDIRCISFWYYLDNTIGAALNVYIRDPRSDFYNLIWSTAQTHGSFWVQQEITVRPNMTVNGTNRFTIVYEAVVGSKLGGMWQRTRQTTWFSTRMHVYPLELAIDDLSTRLGTCQTTTPPPNTYKCLEGTLISLSKVLVSSLNFPVLMDTFLSRPSGLWLRYRLQRRRRWTFMWKLHVRRCIQWLLRLEGREPRHTNVETKYQWNRRSAWPRTDVRSHHVQLTWWLHLSLLSQWHRSQFCRPIHDSSSSTSEFDMSARILALHHRSGLGSTASDAAHR